MGDTRTTDGSGGQSIPPHGDATEGIVVRYWAAARAAAGVAQEVVEVERSATLAEVLDRVRSRHRDSARFAAVVEVCSVLVGDQPVGSADPTGVTLRPGQTVELLPPFAGG
jgi:molybdopterin synthase sulfur carrier subunit